MATWQLQEAKAKLSEVIETAKKNGPQIITQRGVKTAVILSTDEWAKMNLPVPPSPHAGMEEEKRMTLLEFLRSAPPFEIPDRHQERLAARQKSR